MPLQISVCGPGDCTEREWRDAYEVGRLVAARGAAVICGGYGGVMAAVSAGARAARGIAVGVLSGADRTGANPDLSIVIPTGLGQARNAVIARSGDAVIVVGGSWGTLSEIALAKRHGRTPVVQLGGWRVHDQHGQAVPGVEHADSPAEALQLTGLWASI